MGEPNQQHTATFQIPVIIPPELAELTKNLTELEKKLREEIEFYRTNREPMAYTEAQVAALFDMSVKTLSGIRIAGHISYTRIAGKIWYRRAHIEEYLQTAETKQARK